MKREMVPLGMFTFSLSIVSVCDKDKCAAALDFCFLS